MTRRQQTRHSAQSILEFALVLPLFLLLLFGVIDFSRLLFTYVSMSNGAREMARVAAVSNGWTNAAPITAFNNYTIVAGAASGSSSDGVTVISGSWLCADTVYGGGTCSGSQTPTTQMCPFPLQTSTCTLSAPLPGGYVEVQVAYTFQFNPLFQTRLDGILDVSFMRPTAQVTTTARAYVE